MCEKKPPFWKGFGNPFVLIPAIVPALLVVCSSVPPSRRYRVKFCQPSPPALYVKRSVQ